MQGSQLNEQGPPQPFMTMRLWQPRGGHESKCLLGYLLIRKHQNGLKSNPNKTILLVLVRAERLKWTTLRFGWMSRIKKGVVAQEPLNFISNGHAEPACD